MTEAAAPDTLIARYSPEDLHLFDDDERTRFLKPFGETADAALAGDEDAWRAVASQVAWELVYRKEPDLWERLIRGEHIHPDVLAWLPAATSAVEVAAGSGRLTVPIAERCERLIAVEPCFALRRLLGAKVAHLGVEIRRGFFDAIPAQDASADLVVSCSSFTSDPAHGGEPGLREMTRVAAPGGLIAIVWPSDVDWLRERGFEYLAFDGDMCIDFGTLDEAIDLASIVYPWAVDAIAERRQACVPYEVIGMNPPRDIAWKRVD